jgi:rhodanese-related sulfurtransferase
MERAVKTLAKKTLWLDSARPTLDHGRMPGRIIVTVLGLLLSTGSAAADERRVGSPLFDRLLGSLLAHSVPEIPVSEAMIRSECMFLDAREPEEFAVSRISGARPVGYERFDPASVADVPRESCLIVYCSIGVRSERIAEKLRTAGFRNVSNLYGGIFEWVNHGRPVVDAAGRPTLRVHAYGRAWGIWLRRGEKVY